jgi:hypothetical protein
MTRNAVDFNGGISASDGEIEKTDESDISHVSVNFPRVKFVTVKLCCHSFVVSNKH